MTRNAHSQYLSKNHFSAWHTKALEHMNVKNQGQFSSCKFHLPGSPLSRWSIILVSKKYTI